MDLLFLLNLPRISFLNSSLQGSRKSISLSSPILQMILAIMDGERGDYYLFIGRLSEEKGIEVLLDACEHYDFKLKILGDGPLKGACRVKSCFQFQYRLCWAESQNQK